jgi:hypothetical protein
MHTHSLSSLSQRVERVQSCSWDMSADGSRMLSDLVEVDANDFLEVRQHATASCTHAASAAWHCQHTGLHCFCTRMKLDHLSNKASTCCGSAHAQGPHFWDECPYPPQGPCQAGPSGDFQAYVNLFSMAADAIRSRPSAITGVRPCQRHAVVDCARPVLCAGLHAL